MYCLNLIITWKIQLKYLTVVGIVIEIFAYIKNQSNSKLSIEESETIDRYEKRLKELKSEVKENKITKEEYENKKTIIIVSETNTLDLLKKRLREMSIDDLVSEEEIKNIIENINTDNKKAKNKRRNTICIIIIALIILGTIMEIVNSSSNEIGSNYNILNHLATLE